MGATDTPRGRRLRRRRRRRRTRAAIENAIEKNTWAVGPWREEREGGREGREPKNERRSRWRDGNERPGPAAQYLTNNIVHSPGESPITDVAARYITGAIIIICKPPPRCLSFSYLSRASCPPTRPVVLLCVSKWASCLSRREWSRFRRDIRN